MEELEHKEFLLSAIRAAMFRCKMWENELASIGIALRYDMVGPDMAVKMVHDAGLMFMIEPLPGTVGAIERTTLEVNGK
jgi:hypothetical protein